MDLLDTIILFVLVAAIVPLGLFILFYGSRATKAWWRRRPTLVWRSTLPGTALMLLAGSLFTVLLFALLSRFIGDFPGRDVVAFILYINLVAALWGLFISLRKTQGPYEKQDQKEKS